MQELNESIIKSENSQSEVENRVENVISEDATNNVDATLGADATTAVDVISQTDGVKDEVSADNSEEPMVDYSSFTREELLDALKELLKEDVMKIKNRVTSIKVSFNTQTQVLHKEAFEKFLAEGGNKEDYAPAEEKVVDEFKKTINIYRECRQKYQEEQEAIKLRNLELKKAVLEELKGVVESEDSMKNIYDNFNALQERWKSIGDVPRTEINNLWQSYHFLVEKFFNKVKINKELKMLDLKRNLEQKIELCEKVEELIVETSISESSKKLQQYREMWREIGPVPSDKNEEIWVRFCTAAEQIDNRRKEFFEQRREELEKNLLAKTALCEKAEELLAKEPESIKEWNDISNEMNDMLKVWKTIGVVPREVNEEIWVRFKSALDKFFELKKEHFGKLKDDQSNNYNLKLELCLKAEAIAKRDDWKRATDELLKLQEEWKKIGGVPKKLSDKIWLRFRSACDEFFARKAEFYSSIRDVETENLAKKKAIIEKVKQIEFGEDKNENLAMIKELQRQWVEIGYVPKAEKDALQKEFRNTINAHFEKLKISAREAQEANYREKLKGVTGDLNKFASEEKRDLQDKIQKLKSELILWENNLGFLANSKQADLLKDEFEKKMRSAKQQIALLEAKLKMVNELQPKKNEESKESE